MAIAAMLFTCMLLSNASAAQNCDYAIYNETDCDVYVDVEFFNIVSNNCVVCKTINGLYVPPGGGAAYIDCTGASCGGTICDVQVTLTTLGNLLSTPAVVNISNQTANSFVGGPYCSGGEQMDWDVADTYIRP